MLAGVDKAVRAGDAVALQRAAHSLKGAAGAVGGRASFDAALRLEKLGAAADLADAAAAARDLHRAVEGLREELARHLETNPGPSPVAASTAGGG
jgi:HPt (histidine-containing phosphotransfer) domain-containing protein